MALINFSAPGLNKSFQRNYVSPSVGQGYDSHPRTLPSHGRRLQTHTDFLDFAWPHFLDYSMHRVIKHSCLQNRLPSAYS